MPIGTSDHAAADQVVEVIVVVPSGAQITNDQHKQNDEQDQEQDDSHDAHDLSIHGRGLAASAIGPDVGRSSGSVRFAESPNDDEHPMRNGKDLSGKGCSQGLPEFTIKRVGR